MKEVSFAEFIGGIFKCKTIKEIDEYNNNHSIKKEDTQKNKGVTYGKI